jgi:hypothetical protein
MGGLLVAMGVPTLIFGILALLALRYGAESRPYFDERPVHDDRPNWFPIARSGAVADKVDDAAPRDGEPAPAPAHAQAAPAPPASRSRAPSPAAPSPGAA